VFTLFAFQRARASVVIVKQPTCTRFRITHGETTTPAATATATTVRTARSPGRTRQATYTPTTSGSSASRALPRIAIPTAAPVATDQPSERRS